MERVHCSRVGRVMAWASRVTGAPVAHLTGEEVPIDVFVYAEDRQQRNGLGTRLRFRRRAPGHRREPPSAWKPGPDCSNASAWASEWSSMSTNKTARCTFRSTSFYVGIAGRRVRLPLAFSPGVLLVEHIDEGGGAVPLSA